MRLEGIHIFGYGKFIDFRLTDLSSLQIIFGENETGKSTIMSFIHSILFGFPTKQQSSLRYEPKTHSAYGGQLMIETIPFGKVVIERVRGKATGDVTIYLEDGTVGGEELLSIILGGMDKVMFQSIFSFSLHSLGDVHRIKGEDISRYLIAAGTIGSDILFQAEQSFQKELDYLFKPSGHKPILNEYIKQLRLYDKELKVAKDQNGQYESLLKQKEELEEQMIMIEEEQLHNERQLQIINSLIEQWPLFKEKIRISERIDELGDLQFPIDGLKRYEQFRDKIMVVSSRMKALNEKLLQVKQLLEENAPLQPFQSVIEKAEKFIHDWPRYEQLQIDIDQLKKDLLEHHERMTILKRELHYSDESQLPDINLSIDIKGRMKEELKQMITVVSNKENLQTQIRLADHKIEQAEEACKGIESELLPEHEFKKVLLEQEEVNKLIVEKEELENQLHHLRGDREHIARQKRREILLNGGFAFISIILLVWTIVTGQWMVMVFSIMVLTYSLFAVYRNRTNIDKSYMNYEEIQLRIQEISSILVKKESLMKLLNICEEQERLREEWKNVYYTLEQHVLKKEEYIQQEQLIQQLDDQNQTRLGEIKDLLGLPASFSNDRLDEAFELLRELVQLSTRTEKMNIELEGKLNKEFLWTKEIQEMANLAGFEHEEGVVTYFRIKKLLKEEQERALRRKELLHTYNEYLAELDTLDLEIAEYKAAILELYMQANVDNEEAYREKASQAIEVKHIEERLTILTTQLSEKVLAEAMIYTTVEEVKEQKGKLYEAVKNQGNMLDDRRNQLAAFHHQIQLLEEGGTYTEKLHHFYQLESTFNEEAKRWAIIALAKSLLQKTMDTFKQERFPLVMEKANEYLSLLTNGEYRRISIQNDDTLLIERNDGLFFKPEELSQGTGEQLYTALRFALVSILKNDYPFPLIIDDGFVNFDKWRTDQVLQLIEKISESSQVILFTCHEHIRDYFADKHLVSLSRIFIEND